MNRSITIGALGTLVIIGIIISALNTGDIETFLDLRSFLFVFGISATATLITAKEIKQRLKVFSRTAVSTGWLGFTIGLILIMGGFDSIQNRDDIFRAAAVALLPVFYGYIAQLLCGTWLRIIKLKDC